MGALPVRIESKRELPDYLPARMVNQFTYCPRLFFYEWVEGLFAESVDTVEGSIQHRRVDTKATALPDAGELPESIHSRSVTLASERLRVIAKMDLMEVEGGVVTPVDYKHGRPREETKALDSGGVGCSGGGGDSGAPGGFAEVSGVLAGGDLPAGRDVAGGRRGA